MIRVLISDDHKIIRLGLRALLEQEPDLEVVAEASNGQETIQQAQEFKPDVVIMDVAMPGMNGVEATRRLRSLLPTTKILALSMHSDRRYVLNMFEAGASGYMLKDGAFEELAQAVRHIASGKIYLPPDISGIFIKGYQRGVVSSNAASSLLTGREREVIKLIADGKSTTQIAEYLSISAKTVESHRSNLMSKLGLNNIAELTKFALREGLTSF